MLKVQGAYNMHVIKKFYIVIFSLDQFHSFMLSHRYVRVLRDKGGVLRGMSLHDVKIKKVQLWNKPLQYKLATVTMHIMMYM